MTATVQDLPMGSGPLVGYEISVAPQREKTARAMLLQLVRCQAAGDVAMARTIAAHVHNGLTIAEHCERALKRWLAELLGDASGEGWVVHDATPPAEPEPEPAPPALPQPPEGYDNTTYWGEFVPAPGCPPNTWCAGCAGAMDPNEPCGWLKAKHPANQDAYVHLDCWRSQVEFNCPDVGVVAQIMHEDVTHAMGPPAQEEPAPPSKVEDVPYKTARNGTPLRALIGSEPKQLKAAAAELQRRHQENATPVGDVVKHLRKHVEQLPLVEEEPVVQLAHDILEGWPDEERTSRRRLKVPCLICRQPIQAHQPYKQRGRAARVHVSCLRAAEERHAAESFNAP